MTAHCRPEPYAESELDRAVKIYDLANEDRRHNRPIMDVIGEIIEQMREYKRQTQ